MEHKKLIIVLGPPGSGKGTQGRLLQKKLQCQYIATGDLVREMSSRAGRGDRFYDDIKQRKDSGIPQPDSVIVEAVRRKLAEMDLSGGLIFDSFPLSKGQAIELEKIQETFHFASPVVLYLSVGEKSVVERIQKRKYCENCNITFHPSDESYKKDTCSQCGGKLIVRDDDRPEVVKKRFQEYTRRLAEVITYYREKQMLHHIEAEKSVEEVQKDIESIFQKV